MPVYTAPRVDEPLNHGDVFEGVPFLRRAGSAYSQAQGPGVITSHGCDNDRFFRYRDEGRAQEVLDTYPVHVAPVYPAADHAEAAGGIDNLRSGSVRRFFYLAAEGDTPDRVVDLLHEQTVPAILLERLDCHKRLSDETWRALLVHMWVRRSRLEAQDVFKSGQGLT